MLLARSLLIVPEAPHRTQDNSIRSCCKIPHLLLHTSCPRHQWQHMQTTDLFLFLICQCHSHTMLHLLYGKKGVQTEQFLLHQCFCWGSVPRWLLCHFHQHQQQIYCSCSLTNAWLQHPNTLPHEP